MPQATLSAALKFWGKASSDGKASTYHPLPYHSLDVAAVADTLLAKNPRLLLGLAEQLGLEMDGARRLIRFLAALHDLGKFSVSFQSQVPELFAALHPAIPPRGSDIHHPTQGFILWRDYLLARLITDPKWFCEAEAFDQRDLRRLRNDYVELGAAFLGHHGSPPIERETMGAHRLEFPSTVLAAVDEFVAGLHHEILEGRPLPTLELLEIGIDRVRAATWDLAGFAVVVDWLGSAEDHFPFNKPGKSFAEYWQGTLIRAEAAVASSGLLPAAPSQTADLQGLFEHIETPTPMQEVAMTIPLTPQGNLVILEDTTGSGKTEASLALAARLMQMGAADGIYVGLPTMASANAIYDRLAESYRRLFDEGARPSLALAHSRRDLHRLFNDALRQGTTRAVAGASDLEDVDVECSRWIADHRKKALLAHVGVGSIDQALLGVLPVRHQCMRLHGLLRKVVIVDEAHAYDDYMLALLSRLIHFVVGRGGNVIVLSATMPQDLRKRVVDAVVDVDEEWTPGPAFPLLTHATHDGVKEVSVGAASTSRKQIEVRLHQRHRELVKTLVDAATRGRCVGWIRNTVQDAREAYSEIRKAAPGREVILFHSRFTAEDRSRIERMVVDRLGKSGGPRERAGLIVISTQVLEQSLDIDFDVLATDLAPIDLILQRAGRMHRHARRKDGTPATAGERDGRSTPVLHVLSPEPKPDPPEDWFQSFFPRGQFIYPDHARLWLTARILQECGQIQVPDDSRMLVERVYGEEAEALIPEGLEGRHIDAWGQALGDRGHGQAAALKLEQGYLDQNTRWQDDERVRTRLGEPMALLRLAKYDREHLVPLQGGAGDDWRSCEISVRQNQVSGPAGLEPRLRFATETTMPDGGRWSILVPLRPCEDGGWEGAALREDGGLVTVGYDSTYGLTIDGR